MSSAIAKYIVCTFSTPLNTFRNSQSKRDRHIFDHWDEESARSARCRGAEVQVNEPVVCTAPRRRWRNWITISCKIYVVRICNCISKTVTRAYANWSVKQIWDCRISSLNWSRLKGFHNVDGKCVGCRECGLFDRTYKIRRNNNSSFLLLCVFQRIFLPKCWLMIQFFLILFSFINLYHNFIFKLIISIHIFLFLVEL